MVGTQPQDSALYSLPDTDLILLKTYKNIQKRPIRAVLYAMIGQSAKCWDEKHDEYIEMLEERQRNYSG